MTKPLLCVAWVLGGLLLIGCGSRPAPVEVVDSETDADLVPVTIQFTSPKEASQPLCNPFKPEPEVPPAIEAKIADLHPADTLLDTDRQQQVWDAEHVTHMLEWRFGKSFRKALFGPGGQGAEDFFAADLEADVIELADARERTLACVTERYGDRLLLDQQTVDRPMLFTWLRSLVADFTDVQSSSMRVLFIEQTEGTKDSQQNDWRARILLSCRGEGEGGKLLEMLSEHTLRFRWSDDDELYNAAVVADWTAENFSLRESHAKLMRDVTAEVGLADLDLPDNWKDDTSNMLSMQYAVEDFNYDGFLDIALATGAGQQMLLLSDKGKRFVKAAKFPSKEKTRYGWDFSVGVLDYDRDGRADLLIGRRLYKNLGPNKAGRLFEDVTSSAGLRFADSVSMGYSIIDFDLDGHQDIYCNYHVENDRQSVPKSGWIGDDASGAANQLWRNRGDGTFEEVSLTANVTAGKRQTFASVWLHANEDLPPDLYVVNDFSQNVMLLNRGGGVFEDFSAESKTADFATSMGAAAGDFDNDGNTELYVANMYSKMGRRIVAQVGPDDYPAGVFQQIQGACGGNRFYQKVPGEDGYRETSMALGINDIGWAYAPAAFDCDNDGNLDLYATTGFLSFDREKPDG